MWASTDRLSMGRREPDAVKSGEETLDEAAKWEREESGYNLRTGGGRKGAKRESPHLCG